jgi:hypothetical protein
MGKDPPRRTKGVRPGSRLEIVRSPDAASRRWRSESVAGVILRAISVQVWIGWFLSRRPAHSLSRLPPSCNDPPHRPAARAPAAGRSLQCARRRLHSSARAYSGAGYGIGHNCRCRWPPRNTYTVLGHRRRSCPAAPHNPKAPPQPARARQPEAMLMFLTYAPVPEALQHPVPQGSRHVAYICTAAMSEESAERGWPIGDTCKLHGSRCRLPLKPRPEAGREYRPRPARKAPRQSRRGSSAPRAG